MEGDDSHPITRQELYEALDTFKKSMLEVITSRLGNLGLKLAGKQNSPPPTPPRDRAEENRIKTEQLRLKSTEARLHACEVRLSALGGPPFQRELDAVKDRSLERRVRSLEETRVEERIKQAYESGFEKGKQVHALDEQIKSLEKEIEETQKAIKSLQAERVDRAVDFATIKFDIRTIQSKVGLPVNKPGE